jgi:hypothetical protein
LIVPDGRGHKPTTRTAVVLGKLFPRDGEEVAGNALADIQTVLPGTLALKTPLPAPTGVFSSLWDRLIVLDDLLENGREPHDWSPAQLDTGKPGSTLESWLALPWDGPEQIILPGFHTAAERSLKGEPSGQRVFLAVCGLMSAGARTVLLSRWRTGGQTSMDLVREFVQELPHSNAANAWQRSVQLAANTEIDQQREPRAKLSDSDTNPIRADHPFFWAGYLLVDTGTAPHDDGELDAAAAEAAPAAQP